MGFLDCILNDTQIFIKLSYSLAHIIWYLLLSQLVKQKFLSMICSGIIIGLKMYINLSSIFLSLKSHDFRLKQERKESSVESEELDLEPSREREREPSQSSASTES